MENQPDIDYVIREMEKLKSKKENGIPLGDG